MSPVAQTESIDGLAIASVTRIVRVLIVDDHPLFRIAIREILARQPDLDVVAEVGTVAQAIECLANQRFDVAIVDLVLPDGRGSAVVEFVHTAQPECKVLALSGVDEPTQMAEVLRAGACGFALKSQPVDEIVSALRSVLDGVRTVPRSWSDQIEALLKGTDVWPLERLTRREREVFDRLVMGYTNEHIAAELVISKRTVESHRQRVMSKLGTRSLGDMLQLAVRHGLVVRRERSVQ